MIEATDQNTPLHRPPQFSLRSLFAVMVLVSVACSVLRCTYVMERDRRKQHAMARVWSELSELDAALKSYRERFGEYPPQPDSEKIERHIAKVFPKWRQWRADFRAAGLNIAKMDDREALVFWLGGMTDRPGSRKFIGFSANLEHPLEPGQARIGPFFEFDESRLVDSDGDGWWEFVIGIPPEWKQTAVRFDGKTAVLPGVELPQLQSE